LGWPVQGIWPECADGTDINSVDRSEDGKLLATADDFGTLKIFNYPCIKKGSEFVECRGHSSHVT
jgi:microtubule-associated protein-like 6